MAKVAVRTPFGNGKVMSSSECRPKPWVIVYGSSVTTIFPCLKQCNSPSSFVDQRKQECFGVVPGRIMTAGTYQREIEDGTKCIYSLLF